MPKTVLIDYGCHSFSYRLAARLFDDGYQFRYFANGSLESPNLRSLPSWAAERPGLIRIVTCNREYGKMSLKQRLAGEIEWGNKCLAALEAERPDSIIVSCTPLPVAIKIQNWARRRNIPFIYWLQDLQARAISQLLSKRLGAAGKLIGSIANSVEQKMLERSQYVLTIAAGHEHMLPSRIRLNSRFGLLENWANVEEIPELDRANSWSVANGLSETTNIVYSGTLGMKHDLWVFPALAHEFRSRPDVRIVIVSSGQAADHIRAEARGEGLDNLIVLPFQPYEDVPKVLASASVLIAPLDPSAGSFCVPSKILSYLCAGRPTVLAIDDQNPAARMLTTARAGTTVRPGQVDSFVSAVRDLVNQPDLCRHLGRNARTYAEESFRIDHIVSRFVGLMDQAGLDLQPVYNLHKTVSSFRQSVSVS